jgi:predicted HicB family RNase H-like nuclease
MTDSKESKSKYGALIQKAREQENQESVKPDNQITSEPENKKASEPEAEPVKEKEVNLCVKVPESLRRHWAAESKRQGVTMTEVMVAALEARFGRPE